MEIIFTLIFIYIIYRIISSIIYGFTRKRHFKRRSRKMIEYKCTYCGTTRYQGKNEGRPDPGSCGRKSSKTKSRPHTWVVNRKNF